MRRLAAVLVCLTATACGGGASAVAARGGSPSPTATKPKPVRHVATSPLTGLPGGLGRPVLAVKVDNTAPSHPQVGLQDADVVYLEEVEGGYTRVMALFSSRVPEVVGPVRSARLNDLELLREYGHVALAYSGANAGVVSAVRAAPVTDIEGEATAGWFRGMGRHAPYNLFLRPAEALAGHSGVATVRPVGFTFRAQPPAGGRPATGVSVRFSPFASVGFGWDGGSRRWLQSMDGAPQSVLSGQRIGADNVIVQYVQQRHDGYVDVLGNPTPYTVTVGSGRFTLLRNGRAYDGTWSRPSAGAPTRWLRPGGGELPLAPGRTWVLLVPTGRGVTVS